MAPTPPPVKDAAGPAPIAGLDAYVPSAPTAAETLPTAIATAVPYVFELVAARRKLRTQRARLVDLQANDEPLLTAAFADLGAAVRKADLHHPALDPVLTLIAASDHRKSSAVSASGEATRQHEIEDRRLATEEAAFLADWQPADQRAAELEGVRDDTLGECKGTTAALARLQETRQRFEAEAVEREAGAASRPALAEGRAFAAGLRRQVAALAPAESDLKEETSALDERIIELRARAEAQRTEATAKRVRLDGAIAARRQVATDLQTSLASQAREQAEAEREIHELTQQLGQVAARARPFSPALQDAFLRLDNLQDTNQARRNDLDQLDATLASYDKRKFRIGVAMLGAAAVALVLVVCKALL